MKGILATSTPNKKVHDWLFGTAGPTAKSAHTVSTAALPVNHDTVSDGQPQSVTLLSAAALPIDHDTVSDGQLQPVTLLSAAALPIDHDTFSDGQPQSSSVLVEYLTVNQDLPVDADQQTSELFESTSGDLLAHLQCEVSDNPLLLLPLLSLSSEDPLSTLSFNEVSTQAVSVADAPLSSFSANVSDPPVHSAITETPASSHPTRGMQQKRTACSSAPRNRQSSSVGVVTRSGRQRSSNTPLCHSLKSPATTRKKKQKQALGQVTNCVDIPSSSEVSVLSCSDDDDESEFHARSQAKTQKCCKRICSVTSEVEKGHKRYTWKEGTKVLDAEKIKFGGNTELNESVMDLHTRLQFFRFFFTDDVLCHVAEQTTTFSVQQCPENPTKVSKADVEKFVGICMYMSLIRLTNTRYYWSTHFRVHHVADIMTYNNFAKLKRYLHFANNTDDGSAADRLRKMRPFVDMLRSRFLCIPLEEHLSIDEQIVPFKGHHGLKQYMPKKPHKWGYKVFVLSGVSGFAYDIEIYSGKQDNVQYEGEADCGASGNVVTRLSRCIDSHVNYKLYFDNYFNSPDLQLSLARRGILSLGTVRMNRLINCQLPSDVEMKKRGRGAHVEKVAQVGNVELSAVRWYDNRPVTVLSKFVGAEPLTDVKRWSRADSEEKQVSCPKVVNIYNKHMGGVDLLDSLLGLYRCKIRSKKWYHRIFFHLIDLSVVNAWLLYKRVCQTKQQKTLRLHDFKAQVAEGLCKHQQTLRSGTSQKRGRPSSERVAVAVPAKRAVQCTPRPCTDVRFDQVGHFPRWNSSRQRCKLNGCSKLSRVACRKCGVSLCFSSKSDCYFSYHNSSQ